MGREPLPVKIAAKIRRSRRNVFLRSDFASISDDYDQVGRALRQLVRNNQLIRLGYGVYVKAKINSITGKPMIAAKGGFDQVVREALDRLDVEYIDVSKEITAQSNYTQTPPNTIVKTKKRFNRSLGLGNKFKLKIAS